MTTNRTSHQSSTGPTAPTGTAHTVCSLTDKRTFYLLTAPSNPTYTDRFRQSRQTFRALQPNRTVALHLRTPKQSA
jgi:hypothetical protein